MKPIPKKRDRLLRDYYLEHVPLQKDIFNNQILNLNLIHGKKTI